LGDDMNPEMRRCLLGPVIVGTLSAICFADEKPAYVSATFQEVIKRVDQRDADSGAILKVKAHADAPQGAQFGLTFEMREDGPDIVIVSLVEPAMRRIVAEEYRIKADASVREELVKQKLYQLQQVEKRKEWEAARQLKIDVVTAGRFHFGSSPEEVKKALGSPSQEQIWQKAGGLTLVYGETSFLFDGGLVDVQVPEQPTTR
jgi:hypothetical protein